MILLKLLLLLFLLQLEQRLARGYHYCNNKKEHCYLRNMEHFICNIKRDLKPFKGSSKLVGLVPDTLKTRSIFIRYHNEFRNRLAGGELVTKTNKTFSEATRMRELIWDTELAYFARLHSSTVSFKHTQCRSTARFEYVGENLGVVMPTDKKRTFEEILDITLKPMFEEYLMVEDPDDVVKSYDSATDADVGHFTVVASDRVSRVGCAIAAGTDCTPDDDHGQHCHFLACYYDFNNVEDHYVYEMGVKTSNCEIWKSTVSKDYKNLCINTGKIFPKHYDNTIWQ